MTHKTGLIQKIGCKGLLGDAFGRNVESSRGWGQLVRPESGGRGEALNVKYPVC